ncbi:hypothetical protein [Cribrihabitans pelagius]|uniref:hypothetical protein n=1 Tax=Cribrihabitans pelagius TaxID=1765746 RepID=UPI003B591D06
MTVSDLHSPCPGRPAFPELNARHERAAVRALLAGLALLLLLGIPALMAPEPADSTGAPAASALEWRGNSAAAR